jgi:hypothetical protein
MPVGYEQLKHPHNDLNAKNPFYSDIDVLKYWYGD